MAAFGIMIVETWFYCVENAILRFTVKTLYHVEADGLTSGWMRSLVVGSVC